MIIHPGSKVENGLQEVKSKGDRPVRKWQILVWHKGLLTCLGVLMERSGSQKTYGERKFIEPIGWLKRKRRTKDETYKLKFNKKLCLSF